MATIEPVYSPAHPGPAHARTCSTSAAQHDLARR